MLLGAVDCGCQANSVEHGTDDTADDPRAAQVEPQRVAPGARLSARFSRQARESTKPEMLLRRELHRRGLRYRVQYGVPGLPRRRVDVAFTRARLAVFVDGCFWHACPEHCVVPKSNREWWEWKFAVNQARDRDTDQRLGELGWRVLRLWEHEAPDDMADRVQMLAAVPRPEGAPGKTGHRPGRA